MNFDIDTLVEEILAKSILPNWIDTSNLSYLSLENANLYLKFGWKSVSSTFPEPGALLFWAQPAMNSSIPSGGCSSYLRILFRSEGIDITKYTDGCLDLPIFLSSSQDWQRDWQRFLEKDLPEFVKKENLK